MILIPANAFFSATLYVSQCGFLVVVGMDTVVAVVVVVLKDVMVVIEVLFICFVVFLVDEEVVVGFVGVIVVLSICFVVCPEDLFPEFCCSPIDVVKVTSKVTRFLSVSLFELKKTNLLIS